MKMLRMQQNMLRMEIGIHITKWKILTGMIQKFQSYLVLILILSHLKYVFMVFGSSNAYDSRYEIQYFFFSLFYRDFMETERLKIP